jgi:hypothetical protein
MEVDLGFTLDARVISGECFQNYIIIKIEVASRLYQIGGLNIGL